MPAEFQRSECQSGRTNLRYSSGSGYQTGRTTLGRREVVLVEVVARMELHQPVNVYLAGARRLDGATRTSKSGESRSASRPASRSSRSEHRLVRGRESNLHGPLGPSVLSRGRPDDTTDLDATLRVNIEALWSLASAWAQHRWR